MLVKWCLSVPARLPFPLAWIKIRWRCRCSDGTLRFTTGTKRWHRMTLFVAQKILFSGRSTPLASRWPVMVPHFSRPQNFENKNKSWHERINGSIRKRQENTGKTPEFEICTSSSESALPQFSAQSEIELFDNQFFGIDAKEVWKYVLACPRIPPGIYESYDDALMQSTFLEN